MTISFDRSGNIISTILFDGKVIGIWDFTKNPESTFKLFLFKKIGENTLTKIYLEAEAERVGEFFYC